MAVTAPLFVQRLRWRKLFELRLQNYVGLSTPLNALPSNEAWRTQRSLWQCRTTLSQCLCPLRPRARALESAEGSSKFQPRFLRLSLWCTTQRPWKRILLAQMHWLLHWLLSVIPRCTHAQWWKFQPCGSVLLRTCWPSLSRFADRHVQEPHKFRPLQLVLNKLPTLWIVIQIQVDFMLWSIRKYHEGPQCLPWWFIDLRTPRHRGLHPAAHKWIVYNFNGQIVHQIGEWSSDKLRFQKSMGTVKASNALKLRQLFMQYSSWAHYYINQLTISHAKSGFKKENDVDDVWELLFPSRAEKTQEKLTCIQSILACTLVATLICWVCKWS